MFFYWLIFIIFFVLVVFGTICAIFLLKRSKFNTCLCRVVVCWVSVCILVIGVGVIGGIFNNNLKGSVGGEISEVYGLDVNLNSVDVGSDRCFNFVNYYNGNLLGPFVGEFYGDSRLYDIYVRYNDGLCLFTRNEKGVYVPVSDMCVDYVNKH